MKIEPRKDVYFPGDIVRVTLFAKNISDEELDRFRVLIDWDRGVPFPDKYDYRMEYLPLGGGRWEDHGFSVYLRVPRSPALYEYEGGFMFVKGVVRYDNESCSIRVPVRVSFSSEEECGPVLSRITNLDLLLGKKENIRVYIINSCSEEKMEVNVEISSAPGLNLWAKGSFLNLNPRESGEIEIEIEGETLGNKTIEIRAYDQRGREDIISVPIEVRLPRVGVKVESEGELVVGEEGEVVLNIQNYEEKEIVLDLNLSSDSEIREYNKRVFLPPMGRESVKVRIVPFSETVSLLAELKYMGEIVNSVEEIIHSKTMCPEIEVNLGSPKTKGDIVVLPLELKNRSQDNVKFKISPLSGEYVFMGGEESGSLVKMGELVTNLYLKPTKEGKISGSLNLTFWSMGRTCHLTKEFRFQYSPKRLKIPWMEIISVLASILLGILAYKFWPKKELTIVEERKLKIVHPFLVRLRELKGIEQLSRKRIKELEKKYLSGHIGFADYSRGKRIYKKVSVEVGRKARNIWTLFLRRRVGIESGEEGGSS